MTRLCRIIGLLIILALIVGCSSGGPIRERRWLPRSPADIFIDLIDQVSRLGDSIARQFQRMTPRR